MSSTDRMEQDAGVFEILKQLEQVATSPETDGLGKTWTAMIQDPEKLAIIVAPDYLQLFATRLRRLLGQIKDEDRKKTAKGVKICAIHAAGAAFAPAIELAAVVTGAMTKVSFGSEPVTGNDELSASVIFVINAAVKATQT